METNSSSNIFEEASKRLGGSGKQKPLKKKVSESPSSANAAPLAPLSDTDVKSMLERMHFMNKDLENKLESVYTKTGMPKEEIHNFLENPNNFSSTVWNKIQEDMTSLEQKVWAAVGKHMKKSMLKKKTDKKSKERKGKTLGARKKWIPVR